MNNVCMTYKYIDPTSLPELMPSSQEKAGQPALPLAITASSQSAPLLELPLLDSHTPTWDSSSDPS